MLRKKRLIPAWHRISLCAGLGHGDRAKRPELRGVAGDTESPEISQKRVFIGTRLRKMHSEPAEIWAY